MYFLNQSMSFVFPIKMANMEVKSCLGHRQFLDKESVNRELILHNNAELTEDEQLYLFIPDVSVIIHNVTLSFSNDMTPSPAILCY